ncbi:MAG: PAS domain-containing sensor histidine kinase [Gammaproteobacteria bacterium]|nr:PAS domain-containing sensor histidine kinase [Gammaproteobacteria bacterium]
MSIESSEQINNLTTQLRDSKTRFRAIFDQTYQFIGLLTPEGIVIEANRSSLTLTGVEEKDVLGKYFWDTPWWTHSKIEQDRLKDAVKRVASGEFVRFQTSHTDSEGQIHYIDFSLKPVIENNKVTMLIPEGRDITDKVEAQNALTQLTEQLEEKVAERTTELSIKNNELTIAMQRIESAMQQLVMAENLASLGALVPGITHEMSTPLGISVTSISHAEQLTQELARQYHEKNLSKNKMLTYLDDMDESIKIASTSLSRAVDLINSFKQVAIDQASEQKRQFVVKNYIEETLLSLHNHIKQTNLSVQLDCDEALSIESYPGMYSQIITNLLMNSLIYAYDKEDEGKIKIQVTKKNKTLELIFSDDGKGIPDNNLSKIFTPFFSTGKEKGGSGLGLSIIHNIVTEKMHGHIECKSQIRKGTQFTITLPI